VKVAFFLDTTADFFAQWLRHYTINAPYRHFSTKKGRIALQAAQPPDHITGATRIEMEAIHIVPSGEDIEAGSRPFPAISFLVVPLAPERIEVTAECLLPVVMGYFKELLTKIGERWPEAQAKTAIAASVPEKQRRGARRLRKRNEAQQVFVNQKVTFFLHTTVDLFMHWVESYTRMPPSFPTEDGRIILEGGYRPLTSDVPPYWSLGGLVVQPSETFEEAHARARSPGDNWLGALISVDVMQLAPERMEVTIECSHPAVMGYYEELLARIGERWPEAQADTAIGASAPEKQRRGGRPGLDHHELIYRLAKAQEAEEIRRGDPSMTWKEIAKEIDWRYGINAPGLALLRDARRRLQRLEKNDPDALLQEVTQWREAKETNKT